MARIYVVLNQNISRVAEKVFTFGQQLQVFLQGLVDTRPFDCSTLTDLSKGAIPSETSVSTNKA